MAFFANNYLTRLLILSLAAICILNLNGVGYMVLGINQIFSPLILLVSFVLIIIGVRQEIPLSREFILYAFSIILYVAIGGIVGVIYSDAYISRVPLLVFRYFTVLVVTLAAYYGVCLCHSVRLEPLKIILIFSTIATFFIPFGTELNISGKIIVDNERNAGLFGNPNEAGIIAALGFACALVYVSRKLILIALSIFFIVMAVLTFSKAVLLMLIIVYFTNLLLKGKLSTGALRLIVGVVVIYTLIILFRAEIPEQFEGNQARRIEQFISIMMLEPSKESVESSRGYLWKIGYGYIYKHPLFGNGLGMLHSMDGANASVNDGHSQGVHNSYLLKFGDSGIFAILSFVLFLIVALYQSFKLAKQHIYARVALSYFIIFALDCIGTHNVELLRFHNYLMGASIALLFIAKKSLKSSN